MCNFWSTLDTKFKAAPLQLYQEPPEAAIQTYDH